MKSLNPRNKIMNEDKRRTFFATTIQKSTLDLLENFCKENKTKKSIVTEDALIQYIKDLNLIPVDRPITKEDINKIIKQEKENLIKLLVEDKKNKS